MWQKRPDGPDEPGELTSGSSAACQPTVCFAMLFFEVWKKLVLDRCEDGNKVSRYRSQEPPHQPGTGF